MGAMAPYFSVYPLPPKVPTNAAILVSQYMSWTVTVLDGESPIDVRVEPFAPLLEDGSTLAIRPAQGWPPDRSLEVVARLDDSFERRHPFVTSNASHDVAPSCDWTGPSTIHPKSPIPEPDTWPTNIPRPPRNQRTFSVPAVGSSAGYMVAARLWVTDRGKIWSVEVGLIAAAAPSEQPSPYVALTPAYGDDEFSDAAAVIGMKLTDLAGNVSSYGTTT